jgi:hypothetical protein
MVALNIIRQAVFQGHTALCTTAVVPTNKRFADQDEEFPNVVSLVNRLMHRAEV